LDRADRLIAGDRATLARAITLVESTREDHRREAEALVEKVLPESGKSIRLGISGSPGVGKSTFIEAFGQKIIADGHRVAVLAVDPSSRRTGGSILGDKTRMEELSRSPDAFIRPSPSGGTLGGVARRTREAIVLCEAAGFDVIIVETVGVGQSETTVADMVDLFCLLLSPAAGDELQGIKKGIVELAELIVVNKADGPLLDAAQRTVADYRAALRLIRPLSASWQPEVIGASAREGNGLDQVWKAIKRHQELLAASGEKKTRRGEQAQAALWADLGDRLLQALRHRPEIARRIPGIEADVRSGALMPMTGARLLLELFASTA
jgi:LAO/AO transport system kinase